MTENDPMALCLLQRRSIGHPTMSANSVNLLCISLYPYEHNNFFTVAWFSRTNVGMSVAALKTSRRCVLFLFHRLDIFVKILISRTHFSVENKQRYRVKKVYRSNVFRYTLDDEKSDEQFSKSNSCFLMSLPAAYCPMPPLAGTILWHGINMDMGL